MLSPLKMMNDSSKPLLEHGGSSDPTAKAASPDKSNPSGRKKVLVVGAGAAGMTCAHHLAQHPEKFDVTIIDAQNYCGGQAFAIPIDKQEHKASWLNQGVQGGSYIFHHTMTMFARQGYHADPVNLQVSFGKDETFWTNVFPTELLKRHASEVKRFHYMLKITRWFELFFALIPVKYVMKIFLFSDEFTNTVALPMLALFLGTGNATPEVPMIVLERLCTSPTYGMWYPGDKLSVVSNYPPMVVFPNFSDFYETWRKDLVAKEVKVRLSTELVTVLERGHNGVLVKLKNRTPMPDNHNPVAGDQDAPTWEERYDEIVICTLADTAKTMLGKTATFAEKRVLGAAKFSDDITITHTDESYMTKHYENFYRDDLATPTITGKDDQSARLDAGKTTFRPMYYIKEYPSDRSKLEMSFDCTHYQSQFPQEVPFAQHVFQTIFLNKSRDSHLWSLSEIDPSKIIRRDWWHQLCHSWTHFVLVVPWLWLLQGGGGGGGSKRRRTHFAGAWTLVNAHEVAVMSGLAAAVDLGARYPPDLERDGFALLCFRLYYLLNYGKWYFSRGVGDGEGRAWGKGVYGSVYCGPGVAREERTIHAEEVEMGRSL